MSVSSSPVARRRPSKEKPEEAHAPAVWIVSDWVTHPVIESFYGHARHARASSFYDVMCSPMNATATTTLGESCYGYTKEPDDAKDEEGYRHAGATATSPHTCRPFGSFAYSCTTDTSEEAGLSIGPESPMYDRRAPMQKSYSSSCAVRSSSGFAQWNKMRRTMSLSGSPCLVPVPPDHHYTNKRPGASSVLENPQDDEDFCVSVASSLDFDGLICPSSPPTSNRLRAKLQLSLRDVNERIAQEYKRIHQAQRVGKKSRVKRPAAPASNVMWSLLCGTRTTKASDADGLAILAEKLGVTISHRALNQLQRHRRHVRGILQIVTAHNPDLELTERQLDSFEAADVMLSADIKYVVLQQQYKLLATSVAQRRSALVEAKLRNGIDCFEKPQVKRFMLSKLLEAVSWYRLMQRNAREESASSSVGTVPTSELAGVSPSGSVAFDGGLQELQVEKILNVLSAEDFYSDFGKLMCQRDWWEVAQAHFENLIFSSRHSRICQWVLQLSEDVAAVSFEELEENENGGLRSQTSSLAGKGVQRRPQRASWTNDTPPERIIDFVNRLTGRVRREFDVPLDVSKSLSVFIQRTVFPRIAVLCYDQKATRECQRKDKLWRKRCVELSGLPMENLGVSPELVTKICSSLPSRRADRSSDGSGPCQNQIFLVRAIEAFNGMVSVVPCDLLAELMHGVVILHHEAALVLGTTQFSVETFFPLLAYVLVHCRLLTIHAQLHLLENFAITADNANGEESYYVYCVHAAVEYICNTAGLGVGALSDGTCGVSTTSSTLSTTSGLLAVMPMNKLSPRRNHDAFSSELELEGKVPCPAPTPE
uniref:VPS9 domain-containing protein n=1 Tax=Peronospora matthiolae TaxID=2874970 RepID=A0AAV1UYQ5_9STRA